MERAPTRILGIVNMTQDSFSDGGLFLKPEDAIRHAVRLSEEGADAVDLGAASSHPDAEGVSTEEEIRRLGPVIDHLLGSGIQVSVDSFNPVTQRYALDRGVAYLNDIQGFPHPELYPDLAKASCKLVVMHSVQRLGRATRVEGSPEAVLEGITAFLTERVRALEKGGVRRERIILDPGMGFFLGSNPEPSLLALRNLGRLRERFGLPVLISVSRKSFLRSLTNLPVDQMLPATLAAELYAAGQGADYIRTHDVRSLRDALAIFGRLSGD
jgi:dihydropteroate synthase